MLRFSLHNLAGEGLFTFERGALARKQRKIMAPLFQPKALEAYAEDMVGCALRTVDGWKDGQELELSRETTRLTMGIAGKTLFDAVTPSPAPTRFVGHALTVALAWTGWVVGRPFAIGHVVAKRALERLAERTTGEAHDVLARGARRFEGPITLVGPRGRELAKAIAFLDEHVQKMIDERRRSQGAPRNDLMTRLLEARDEDGRAMSDRQVRDEVLTLFVAGHETTATGLASLGRSTRPARNREILRGVGARGQTRFGDAPGVADLPRLDLCLRAFKEALRLYPPVYVFGRDSKAEVTIGGYDLPAPTNVLTSPWVLHHSARLYPDPERFDPDRFLPRAEAARHRYAYLPFGAGPRICLGNHFAYMEAQLGLAVLLRRFDFEKLLGDDEPEPSATLRPKHGVRVRVKKRR